jgi:hypothetical protein
MKCFAFRSLAALSLAASLLLLAACGSHRPPPPPLVVAEQPPTWNYEDRRIAGRETLAPWPGIAVHADEKKDNGDGTTTLSGRVYVDATAWKAANPKLFASPFFPMASRYYCEKATWDPGRKLLSLTGLAVGEDEDAHKRSRVMGTYYDTRMELHADGKLNIVGPSKSTTVTKPLQPEEHGWPDPRIGPPAPGAAQ